MSRVWQNLRGGWQRAARALSTLLQQSATCRECRERVNPLEDICPHCGTYGPARFPVSPSCAITVLGCVALLFLMRLT